MRQMHHFVLFFTKVLCVCCLSLEGEGAVLASIHCIAEKGYSRKLSFR